MNKECAREIRCRVSSAALSVSSAALVLPQLQWKLTITTEMLFFFFLFLLPLLFPQMDLQDLKV